MVPHRFFAFFLVFLVLPPSLLSAAEVETLESLIRGIESLQEDRLPSAKWQELVQEKAWEKATLPAPALEPPAVPPAPSTRPISASSSEMSVRFSHDILPLLSDKCFKCHGPDETQRKAGLRLDDGEGAFQTLRSGAVPIVRGDPGESELVRRVTSVDEAERMPPPESGVSLSRQEIETIVIWIENGAEWETHWAFKPPQSVDPPSLRRADWVRNGIDAWILARLESENLEPSPEADKQALVRRLSLDLTGLPPTPEEVDRFLEDSSATAYEDLVDRLLASPHFGEKWARWWLDLCGYADTDGYLSDFLRPWSWRYRDWVIEALNRDLPFDRFALQQVAGDLLPEATLSTRLATGFLRHTLSNREGGAGLEEFRTKQVVDRTKLVGTAFLGLTVGCAECHDHKYDPISQREFFSLYACFNNADERNLAAPLGQEGEAFQRAKPEYDRKRAELLAPVAGSIERLQREWEKEILFTEANPGRGYDWERALELLGLVWGQGEGEGQLEGLMIAKTPWERRTADERDRLQDYFLRNGSLIAPEEWKQLGIPELVSQLDELEKSLPKVSRAPAMARTPIDRTTQIHIRGDFRNLGEVVEARAPAVLPPLPESEEPARLRLARWLVSEENPLTARVTANRLWQELFGQGLVATSDDFGVQGDRPSHPELLDWLALEFSREGWSLKRTLRLLVTSNTYRQSSNARPDLQVRDPSNRLLARQSRVRLPAETIRDSALFASGLLNAKVGGPSIRPPQPDSVTQEGFDNKWETTPGEDRYRRGLYVFLQRTSPFAQLVNFDLPDVNRPCTRRIRSNTPVQALNLLNDPNFFEAARALGARLQSYSLLHARRSGQTTLEDCIDYGFRLCLGRSSTDGERTRLRDYLEAQIAILASEQGSAGRIVGRSVAGPEAIDQAAWIGLASVLLNLDEFVTRG